MRTLRNNARYTMEHLHPEPTEIPEHEFDEAVDNKICFMNDDFRNAIYRHRNAFGFLEDLVNKYRRGDHHSEVLKAAENLAGAIIEELELNVKADHGY